MEAKACYDHNNNQKPNIILEGTHSKYVSSGLGGLLLSLTSPEYHLQCLVMSLTVKNLIWFTLGQLLGILVSSGFQYLAFT